MNATATLTRANIDLADIQPGDVFSESSHYTYTGMDNKGNFVFDHAESGTKGIKLSPEYVENFLSTADQYTEEVKVGKLDKKWTQAQINKLSARALKDAGNPQVGDVRLVGIRTLWDSIHSAKVFTVCFQKQGKDLSATALRKARQAQLMQALDEIEKARKSKKSISSAAEVAMRNIQDNPIETYVPGDLRELRGYKVQFDSIDGRYQCMDMDINQLRPVNINTIQWLVIDGVKYIVE